MHREGNAMTTMSLEMKETDRLKVMVMLAGVKDGAPFVEVRQGAIPYERIVYKPPA